MNKTLKDMIKFEAMLLSEKVKPLSLIFHGSSLSGSLYKSDDIDVAIVVEKITPNLYKKLRRILGSISTPIGLSLVSAREAGTIFAGLKYHDAVCRCPGKEAGWPLAYYEIATRNELFKKSALAGNYEKCVNIAKIITKSINNYSGTNYSLNIGTIDKVIVGLENNLEKFFSREKLKGGIYHEDVKVFNR